VVGLGKSGLAAALFLRRRGALVTVSDVRSAQALAKEIPALIEAGIMVEAGGHGLLTFRPPGSDRGQPRRAAGYSRTGAGEELRPARDRRTGAGRALPQRQDAGGHRSNGKTTTTTLLGEILSGPACPRWWAATLAFPWWP